MNAQELLERYENGERDFSEANLRGANLCEANLCEANLCDADLHGANLRGATLHGANLCDADLHGANLCEANLCEANLRGADLRGADLYGANLRGANLHGANLCDADLQAIQEDLLRTFSYLTREQQQEMIEFIKEGKVDGSRYTGTCVCWCGTIAKIRGVYYDDMEDIPPQSSSPRERWFLGIRAGDTPETNQISEITVAWLEEYLKKEEEELAE